MSLEALQFDNRLIEQLPADKVCDNHCRSVEHAAYSYVKPTPTKAPKLITFSAELAQSLDLKSEDIAVGTSKFA